MRFFLVVSIIAIIMGLFFISLDGLGDYGVSSLILAGISVFALFRIFKYLFEFCEQKNQNGRVGCSDDVSDPIDYLIYGEIGEEKPDDN